MPPKESSTYTCCLFCCLGKKDKTQKKSNAQYTPKPINKNEVETQLRQVIENKKSSPDARILANNNALLQELKNYGKGPRTGEKIWHTVGQNTGNTAKKCGQDPSSLGDKVASLGRAAAAKAKTIGRT